MTSRNLWDYIGHAYRPHPAIQGVDLPALRMLELNVSKGRQVINFMVGTATTLSGVFNASYTMLQSPQCVGVMNWLVIPHDLSRPYI